MRSPVFNRTASSGFPRTLSRVVAAVGVAFLWNPFWVTESARAGMITNGSCVNESNGDNNVCTSNDLTFVLVGLGLQSDGCVSTSDSVSIRLRAIIRNTTAQTRYDVGLFVATDGDPNNDGALSSASGTGCSRTSIDPPFGTTGVATCGPLDLDGPISGADLNTAGLADGPYLNADGDACADLLDDGASGCDENGDTNFDDSVVDFPTPVTFPCEDAVGDGFVDIGTCATWGNNNNQVGGASCDGELELQPGVKSKCRCEDVNSTIPAPRLECRVTCTPTTIQAGGTTNCQVELRNTSTCTPNLSTPEREQCGTAGYVRLRTEFDEAVGSVSGITTSGPASGNGGSASVVTESGNQLIRWTPASTSGTAGVVGPNITETMSFDYTLNTAGTTTAFTSSLYWSNDPNFLTTETQQVTCTGGVVTTPVTLASFKASRGEGSTVVEWTTATEAGVVGYNVYEETAFGKRRVNRTPIASRLGDSTSPQNYRVEIPSSDVERYYLESVDVDGAKRLHGPFGVGRLEGRPLQPEAIDWAQVRNEIEPTPGRPRSVHAAASAGASAVELLVDQTGLQRVTYEALLAAGFDFRGVATNRFALTVGGVSVAIRAENPKGNGGTFGPGAFIEFYGIAVDAQYTSTRVYALSVDPASGKRVAIDNRRPGGASSPYYLETRTTARNLLYSFGSPIDPWYDTRMLTFTASSNWNFNLAVDGLVDAGVAPVLEVNMWGSTVWDPSPDHHVRIALNGVTLSDELFDGRTVHIVTLPLPAGLLREGSNTLTLTMPGDLGVSFDLVNLESYSITYPRRFTAQGGKLAFETTGTSARVDGLPNDDAVAYRLDGAEPVFLAGASVAPGTAGYVVTLPASSGAAKYVVAAASSLGAPRLRAARQGGDLQSGAADYLIISHSAFLGSLGPLVAMHQSQGQSVKVVDVEDVYQLFSASVIDPDAIRRYVAYAAQQLGTRQVLLVGGDTYDYRDYLHLGSVSFIPSHYAATGSLIFHAPVDPWYADLDGDNVPDLPIGRLPVRTASELDSVITKILDYGQARNGRAVVLAADRDGDGATSFASASEHFLDGLGSGWQAERAYLDQLAVSDARAKVIHFINEGAALTSFVGHSGPSVWSFSGLLNGSDVLGLSNAGEPTVVVQWGCWNTYYAEPRADTLAHRFLLSGDRGAAAVLGSATLLSTSSAEALSERLSPLLAKPGTTLGEAITAAKKDLARTDPELLDALLGWTLLGDPGMAVEP